MQVMIHNEGGIGIPMFLSILDGHVTRLKGLSPLPLGGMMASALMTAAPSDPIQRCRDEMERIRALAR